MAGINERLRRLERKEGGGPEWTPIPREHVHFLDVLAALRREGLWNPPNLSSELLPLLVERGVDPDFARDLLEQGGDG